MVALGLALGASIAWGGSDFLAGLVTRRLPVLTVLVLSQAAGLVLLLILLALAGQPPPPADAVLIAGGAGLAEMLGFAALYRALAIGPMTVVAPLASLAAVVPVACGRRRRRAPGARGGHRARAGRGLWCPGGLRARSRLSAGGGGSPRARRSPPSRRWPSAPSSWAPTRPATPAAWRGRWPSTAARRSPPWPWWWPSGAKGLTYRSADLRPAAVIGLLDAGANALFALALTQGMTSTVGVIGSLYPVTTVVLATVILRERPRALQAPGRRGRAGRRRSRDRLDGQLEPRSPSTVRRRALKCQPAQADRTVRDAY